MLGSCALDKYKVNEQFKEANGLVLSSGSEKFQIHVLENQEGETTHFFGYCSDTRFSHLSKT